MRSSPRVQFSRKYRVIAYRPVQATFLGTPLPPSMLYSSLAFLPPLPFLPFFPPPQGIRPPPSPELQAPITLVFQLHLWVSVAKTVVRDISHTVVALSILWPLL